MMITRQVGSCATAFAALLAVVLSLCPGESCAQDSAVATVTYEDAYRPQFHFSPPTNWMNDPNGMVYYDGEYHLFYQYNPFGIRWGHMHWGHAVSRDLVHWQHLPVAISETDSTMIFSGSAVVDWQNTSGFGEDGEPPLVAIYTAHYTTKRLQAQYVAFSNDRGRTWTKYAHNPVLDIGDAEFRDPKVFWYEPGEKWVMVVALPLERKVRLYESIDLKNWSFMSDFGPAGSADGLWECPDLFELPVEKSNDTRWVLEVDVNAEAVAGGSGGQYFVGSFDGTRFIAEHDDVRWADFGRDFYAAVSWSDVPEEDGRRLWLGWMNNWLYGQDIPTEPWRSAQSIPRSLTLHHVGDEHYLAQEPVAELTALRDQAIEIGPIEVEDGEVPLGDRGLAGRAFEMVVELETGDAAAAGVKVRIGEGEETVIGYARDRQELFIDRRRSGDVGFHPAFATLHAAPVNVSDGVLRLHLFVDRSSVEVFTDGGRVVMTDLIFPSPDSQGLAVFARRGRARIKSATFWPVRSIWNRNVEARAVTDREVEID